MRVEQRLPEADLVRPSSTYVPAVRPTRAVMMSAVSTPTSDARRLQHALRHQRRDCRAAGRRARPRTRPGPRRCVPIASPVPVRPPSRSSASSEGPRGADRGGQARDQRGQERRADGERRPRGQSISKRPPARAAVLRARPSRCAWPSSAIDASSRPSSVASALITKPSASMCSDQAAARGAERRAHGRLAHAIGRAREQQVRDVRAGDQQHEADRHQQRPDELRRRRR